MVDYASVVEVTQKIIKVKGDNLNLHYIKQIKLVSIRKNICRMNKTGIRMKINKGVATP